MKDKVKNRLNIHLFHVQLSVKKIHMIKEF
jgi:hypothetical protein